MMEWYQILSFFCSNGIRIFLCLFLIAELLASSKINRKAVIFSIVGAGIVTALSLLPLSQFYLLGIEILIVFAITHFLFRDNPRLCLFLIFFYEIGLSLWEFLLSAGLAVLFQSENFIDAMEWEYMIAVWVVRFILLGIVVFIIKKRGQENKVYFRLASMVALLGMLGVIALSGQSVILLSDDRLTTWIILSLIILFGVLFFNLNRQYEMEKEIARLKAEQTELLERDYQTLNKSYTTNAKLFHDLHNHVEVMYHYLIQGKTTDAVHYLEDLRTPIQEITQTIWTGDEAIDYLINSKISLAEQAHIITKTSIEFPRNMNIRSVDLTAILGNLLDNALEAAENSKGDLRFVYLTIRRINNMLVIKVENGCDAMPVMSGGEMQSSKRDKLLHGWGLKSIRTAAEHYDGTVETSYNDNIFCAVTTLSYDALKTE